MISCFTILFSVLYGKENAPRLTCVFKTVIDNCVDIGMNLVEFCIRNKNIPTFIKSYFLRFQTYTTMYIYILYNKIPKLHRAISFFLYLLNIMYLLLSLLKPALSAFMYFSPVRLACYNSVKIICRN